MYHKRADKKEWKSLSWSNENNNAYILISRKCNFLPFNHQTFEKKKNNVHIADPEQLTSDWKIAGLVPLILALCSQVLKQELIWSD